MIEIPEVDIPASPDLALLKSRLGECPSFHLGQSWLPYPEAEFEPGTAFAGHCGRNLMVFAELQDSWIHNPETERNALAFLRGDTFEIFLHNEERQDYWEFHVTPRNVIFQACFPLGFAALRRTSVLNGERDPLPDYLHYDRVFFSRTWIGDGIWHVFATIPFELLGIPASADRFPSLRVHFARYNYAPKRAEPVLSSSAQFSGPPDFHDQGGWSRLGVSRTRFSPVDTVAIDSPPAIVIPQGAESCSARRYL